MGMKPSTRPVSIEQVARSSKSGFMRSHSISEPYASHSSVRSQLAASLVAETVCVLANELREGAGLHARDRREVVEDLIGTNVDAVGEVGVAVKYALHVGRFGTGGQHILQELRRRTRLV